MCARCDFGMSRYSYLTSEHAPFAYLCRACHSHLRRHHSVCAYFIIVSYLHKIVEFYTVAYFGCSHHGTVHTRVCSNFHVVAYFHVSYLRNLFVAVRCWCETESVGSYELLEDIDRQAEKLGIVQSILLEVNVGGEEVKSGFAVSEVRAAAERAKSLSHVVLRGLMTIPPVAESEHGSVPYFEKVHALYVDINASLYDNKLDILSMGMSGDYEDAVRCGATMVRVGTAIFGARHYTL